MRKSLRSAIPCTAETGVWRLFVENTIKHLDFQVYINGHFWKICNWNFEVGLAWCLRLRLLPSVLVGQSNYVRNVRLVSFASPQFVPQMSFVYLNFSVFIKCNRKLSITFSITFIFCFPLIIRFVNVEVIFVIKGKF